MSEKSEYDSEQDATVEINVKTLKALIQTVERFTGQDVTPTEWIAAEEPVPFTDQAVYPPYVIAGHLVGYVNGQYQCICHDKPPQPFNPYWGVEGHPLELIGIRKYDAEKHSDFILTYGDREKPDRLARIAEVLENL